jgi:hypothetical protein
MHGCIEAWLTTSAAGGINGILPGLYLLLAAEIGYRRTPVLIVLIFLKPVIGFVRSKRLLEIPTNGSSMTASASKIGCQVPLEVELSGSKGKPDLGNLLS